MRPACRRGGYVRFCTFCGHELAHQAQFCTGCGAPVPPITWQAQASPVIPNGVLSTSAASLSQLDAPGSSGHPESVDGEPIVGGQARGREHDATSVEGLSTHADGGRRLEHAVPPQPPYSAAVGSGEAAPPPAGSRSSGPTDGSASTTARGEVSSLGRRPAPTAPGIRTHATVLLVIAAALVLLVGVGAVAVPRLLTLVAQSIAATPPTSSARTPGAVATSPPPGGVVVENEAVREISAGSGQTCAVTTRGGVKCWGNNELGQLGDGTNSNRSTPVDVVGLGSGITAISAGNYHTCALTSAGGVKCWGSNNYGELGDGTTSFRLTPVDVVGLSSGVTAISSLGSHACAVTTVGAVKCWGLNNNGQLGDGTTTNRSTPVDVLGLNSGVTAISANGTFSCALTTGGGVKCWGWNKYGQLGDGTTTNRSAPVDVVNLSSGVSAIAAGGQVACALTSLGGAKCWGRGDSVGYGNANGTNDWSIPVDVSGLNSGVITISAGTQVCALTSGGGVKCWGSTPADIAGLSSGVTAVSAGAFKTGGGSHSCALTRSGGVKCWGWNQYGQLGDGTTTDGLTPVDVVGLGSA